VEPGLAAILTDGVKVEFTVALVVADVDPQPLVIVTVYVPVAAVVAPVMVGFGLAEEKPFGPDQLKVNGVVPAAEEVKFRLDPAQIGLLLPALAPDGAALTTIVTVFDVAVAGDAHVALEVIIHETWSPLASELFE